MQKGPYGPANLAAIKDINYAIINRLRHVRDRVTCAAPQPVLKDEDIYCPGHWPLHRPVPNLASLKSGDKAKEPSRTREHPLPIHRCALALWKTHLGPVVQKAKATADSRKEAGKTSASPSGARGDFRERVNPDASGWAWTTTATCARSSSDAPRWGGSVSCPGALMPPRV